ncbi:MAG: hypothetical protein AB7S26_21350 [Sandaracinaceae bacterium]
MGQRDQQERFESFIEDRWDYLQPRGIELARRAAKELSGRAGEVSCATGLDQEDFDDEDVGEALSGMPSGTLLALTIIGASKDIGPELARFGKGAPSPFYVGKLAEAHFAATLTALRGSRRAGRRMVRAVADRDPAALGGRLVAETAYLAVMASLHTAAKGAKGGPLVHPSATEEALEKIHRTTFDVYLYLLERWANGRLGDEIMGKSPESLYGMLVGDAWRSETAAIYPDLECKGQDDLRQFLGKARPRFSPWTYRELIDKAKKILLV